MEHKTFIDLSDTSFEPLQVLGREDFGKVLAWHKGKAAMLNDFGTVLIGWDNLQTDEQRSWVLELSAPEKAPIFTIPEDWRFPQLMKAVGAFKSSSQAAKNGWNKDIDVGITEIVLRINKCRGSLWIHKIDSAGLPCLDEDEKEG